MPFHLLVVDDEWGIRELFKIQFASESNFQVSFASNREEFAVQVKTHPPDLIVLDLMIGQDNGLEMYNAIYASESHKTPVLFLTALNQDHAPSRAKQGRHFALHSKPFNHEELLEDIHLLLKSNA